MIDTVKGYLDLKHRHINEFKDFKNSGKITKKQSGYSITNNISNFKITLKVIDEVPVKIMFNGSLPKLYYQNNLAQLDWRETGSAIEMLSDSLNINFSKANLTRVDFGINLIMNYDIREYLDLLLSFPRLDKHYYGSTVKFTKRYSYKHLQFYDKLEEIKSKNKKAMSEIPMEYKSQNILRYELQLNRNLKKRLNPPDLRMNDLLSEKTQNKIVDLWLLNYSKVRKLQLGLDPQYLLHTHNGLYKYLAYYGIEKIGFERLNNLISNKDFNVKNLASKRSKLKYVIKELASEVKENTLDKGLIGELDSKIKLSKELIF